jgi:hypothetical protein
LNAAYGLNWGDLVTLSKVVKFARQQWGEHWARSFRDRMKHFQNHLSTMEELWWLSLWKSPLHVQYECLFYAPSWRPVDWQFEIQGVAIDLEIKYRRFDWLRFVDPVAYEHAGLVFPNAGGQVSGPSCRAGQPRRHDAARLRHRAECFLASHPTVDGFLFWSVARRDLPGCECVLRRSCEFVRDLLRPADEEDRWRNPFVFAPRPSMARTNDEPDFNPLYGLFENPVQRACPGLAATFE